MSSDFYVGSQHHTRQFLGRKRTQRGPRIALLVSSRVSLLVFLAACGSGTKYPGVGPCEIADKAAACEVACDPLPGGIATCEAGFYCAPDGFCFAQCTQGGSECGSGYACSADGRCVSNGVTIDGGPDADCPDVNFIGTRTIPTVELLIDQSSSMTSDFGGVTRWQAVVTALVGPMGVVRQTEADIVYGATLYSNVGAQCPGLIKQGRALNNFAALDTFLNGNIPQSGTPTGQSIAAVITDFVVDNPPAANSPPFIVLATDGQPNSCPGSGITDPEGYSVQQVQAAYTAGIQTFVLSVGPEVAQAHLQQLANAGKGLDPGSGMAPYFVANDPAALATAFQTIVNGVVSCDFDINGQVDVQQASSGTVTLNGELLTYGTDWILVDSNTISLIDAACDTLKSTSLPQVNAQFPCGAIIE